MTFATLLYPCLIAATWTPATILIKKDLRELCQEAELVVEGEVVSNSADWNADRTLIWTQSKLAVTHFHLGQALTEVTIFEPGGAVGPIGQDIASMARYTPGERVIVFLKRDVLGQWRTHGCIQGRFSLDGEQVTLDPGLLHVHGSHFRDAEAKPRPAVARTEFLAKISSLLPGDRK